MLIKAVANVIPIYTMQCFRVPKKVCEEVNAAMARFWWGQKEDEKKIHWVKWLTLTKRKEKGGMGFKDLYLLNIALLAKQCWRIIRNPKVLWVKIIKGVYFPKYTILEAKKGAKASWAWMSILEGRDFFKENMMWQVMNGKEINF